MKIGILTIGDEVVIGKVVNSNATHIAKVLEDNHLVVMRHLSVKDDLKEIVEAMDYLFKNVNVIITTGGLGPTVDDITKEAVAKYFNVEMALDKDVLDKIKVLFKSQQQEMPISNIKQAYFIKDSLIINNNNGTAPGMIYENDNKIVINLPGPPQEMRPMLNESVIPFFLSKTTNEIIEKRYRLMNIGESYAESLLEDLYKDYPNVKIAPYANMSMVDYLISISNLELKDQFIIVCKKFEERLKDYIIGDWSKMINELLISILANKKLTLACAESCTGGMLTSFLIDVPGSSQVINESFITYSNEAKHKRLGVSNKTLKKYGAVSRETAIEMAYNIAKKTNSNIGLATTGIAGPTGGTPEKPVGLVYTAIYFNDEVKVFENHFSGNRSKVRTKTVMTILFQLYKEIIKTF